MPTINPNEEFIVRNYENTIKLIGTMEDDLRSDALMGLFRNAYSEKYMLCPASTQKAFYSSFPGGLCYHNLHVLKWLKKFSDLMASSKYSTDTLLTVSLLHEIGKIGDGKKDYYLPLDSDWHRGKGIFYEINRNIMFMRVPQRSLYLAAESEIDLTQEEYLAILLHEGMLVEENKPYAYKTPELAQLLFYADQHAISIEKQNRVIFP